MSDHRPAPDPALHTTPGTRIAVIAARWNAPIVDRLLSGCLARLAELGVHDTHRELYRVPGSLELPVAAKAAAESRRFAAVIVLGCVIRGETWHFQAVAGQCAAGIRQASLDTGIPIIFGVLTVENEAQALDRSGGPHGHAGRDAADAAVDMARVLRHIRLGPPPNLPTPPSPHTP